MNTLTLTRTYRGVEVKAKAVYVGRIVMTVTYPDVPHCFEPSEELSAFMWREAQAELMETTS